MDPAASAAITSPPPPDTSSATSSRAAAASSPPSAATAAASARATAAAAAAFSSSLFTPRLRKTGASDSATATTEGLGSEGACLLWTRLAKVIMRSLEKYMLSEWLERRGIKRRVRASGSKNRSIGRIDEDVRRIHHDSNFLFDTSSRIRSVRQQTPNVTTIRRIPVVTNA